MKRFSQVLDASLGPFVRSAFGVLLLLLLIGGGGVVAAQEDRAFIEDDPPTLEGVQNAEGLDVSRSLSNRAAARWWRRRALEERGDRSGAATTSVELESFMQDEGIRRLEALAGAAAAEGRTEAQAGRATIAAAAFQFSRGLDPLSAEALWGEAKLTFEDGRWGEAIHLGLMALSVRWESFWARFCDLVNLAGVFLASLLLAGALSIPVLLFRHGPELVREVDWHLPRNWHPLWRSTIGWAVVLSPVAVVFLGAWCLLIWAVMLVPACRLRERSLIYAWLILLVVTTPVMGGLRLLGSFAASQPVQVAIAAAEGSMRPDLAEGLAGLVTAHPDEAIWSVHLARLLAARHPNRAVSLLRDAARADPADPRIRVALGNVLFRVGKHEGASVYYREARDLGEGSILGLFNLARVHLTAFDFDDADLALEQARKISPDELQKLESRTPEDDVADPEFQVSETVRTLLRSEFQSRLGQALNPVNPLSLIALGALLSAWVLRIRLGQLDFCRCETCGKAAGSRSGEMTDAGICTACNQLLSRREGLAPAARKEQAKRIETYLSSVSRQRNLVHLVWPGLGLIHEGRVWLGWLMSSVWAGLLLAGLLPARFLALPFYATLWPAGLVFLALAVLFWVICQLPRLRPLPVSQPFGRR